MRNMKNLTFALCLSLLVISCKETAIQEPLPPSKIAFGSCCIQVGDLTIFDSILKMQPQLYLALGDNMYGDAIAGEPDKAWLELNYTILGNNASFKRLKSNVPMIATWDDHDFGGNNRGSNYTQKQDSKDAFLSFFNEPAESERRHHPGIYTSYFYGDEAHRLQIIVLDTRWFLDVFSGEPISPTSDTSKHFLGQVEWDWLKAELLKPAKVRIIMTSTQMLHEHNGYESWTNYPHELNRFFQLLKETRANGVFMVSGDVHYAELSKRSMPDMYPLYDMTSSGLNQVLDNPQPNMYRVGNGLKELNFGMINIDWNSNPISISLEVYNKKRQLKIQQTVTTDELKF